VKYNLADICYFVNVQRFCKNNTILAVYRTACQRTLSFLSRWELSRGAQFSVRTDTDAHGLCVTCPCRL